MKDASDGDHPKKLAPHSLELDFSNKEDIPNNYNSHSSAYREASLKRFPPKI